MASWCSQRQTVVSLMLATSPEATAWRAISGTLQRDKGTCCWLGNSQARALICTTTSGGKRPGAARSREFLQASQAFGEESLAPQADHFAACIQAPGNFIIGQSFGGMKDHSGARNLKIRQRIFGGAPG